MAANNTLLRKQELLESALGDKARVLEAEERELSHRVDACLQELAQAGGPPRDRSILGLRHQHDTATLTTRAGVYSASERAAWDADLERFKVRSLDIAPSRMTDRASVAGRGSSSENDAGSCDQPRFVVRSLPSPSARND